MSIVLEAAEIERLKKQVAQSALQYVKPDSVLGVGSGSTVNALIDALVAEGISLKGAVAASLESERRLKAAGIEVLDFNWVDGIDVYIDGADEVTPHLCLTKGGGAALTREKILASAARTFVCMVDVRKRVDRLGKFPIPIEVIPFARSAIARKLVGLGGHPTWREGVVTDNGNIILDVRGMDILDPYSLELVIEALPGVVCCGIFAKRTADIVLTASSSGIEVLKS